MSDSGPSDDPVLGSTGYLLIKAGLHVGADFEDAMSRLGLSMREFLVLSFVAATEGLSQLELSRRLGLDPTIVVGLVDGLEARDLLVRSRDPDDRRRNVLTVTPAGRSVRSKATADMAAVEGRFLAPLTATQRAELRATLHRMMAPRLPWLG